MADGNVPYWTIRHVEIKEAVPGQTFTVFMLEDDREDARYFDLQRMLEEPGPQEIDLELDSYCIVSESEGVDYGGLAEVTMLQGRLVLQFRPEAVEELELPSEEIILGIAPDINVHELWAGMQKVLTYGNRLKVPSMRFM
ncbi:Imm10 family immunity protein [Streptomyces sp. G2]|uniref:Imm10 family immunity protein n=1 Tax=Streptomyces sp. G2 TaxID=1684471 RepID=UPI002030055B|nr:Imm10 family immunity protein [Streptomyces sp. G2]MCM1949294.1 Imm10 family immunity protein [Streptomyces sp. G2]